MTDGGEEKSSVTVRIAGEEHTIRANAEPEYTRSCARFVDERIAEIRAKSGLIEGYKAAILAALSITDEYFQAREELEDVRERTGSRARELAHRLDETIHADESEAVTETGAGDGARAPAS